MRVEGARGLRSTGGSLYAKCCEETIRRAYYSGQLRKRQFGGRHVRIVLADLVDWLIKGARTKR